MKQSGQANLARQLTGSCRRRNSAEFELKVKRGGCHKLKLTVQILCIGTDRSQQTVQTKIRSDQGLRCLPVHQHFLDALMQCYVKRFYF